MVNEIKTRIAVDGEAKFKKAISQASTSVKNIGSQLRLATAEFKLNGDAQKLMEERSKALNEQIAQQTEIVKAMEGALADSVGKYGENSAQAEKWSAKLNAAKASLMNMQAELRNNEQGLDKNGRAFAVAGAKVEGFEGDLDSLGAKAAKGIDFQATNQALESVKNKIEDVTKKIVAFGKSAWEMVLDSSQWADDLQTLSDQTQIDKQTLQGWTYASHFIDVEVSSIANAMTKLVNPTGTVKESLEELGVALTDSMGNSRDKNDIFWDALDALNKAKASGQNVDELAKEIFGKSYQELMPLIKEGREGWEGLVQEANEVGYVKTDEEIAKLTSFNDTVAKLEMSIETLKRDLSITLAPAFQTVADALNQFITDFNTWAQSEEGQKALGNISSALQTVADTLLNDVDFNTLVGGATDVITKLGEALSGITHDPSSIITGVKGALFGYALLKVGSTVMSFLQFLNTASFLGITTATTAGISSVSGSVATVGGVTISKTVTGFLGSLGAAIVPAALVAGSTGILAANLSELAKDREFGWTTKLQSISVGLSSESVSKIKSDIQSGITEGIQAAARATSIIDEIEAAWDEELNNFQLFTSGSSFSQNGRGLNEGEYNRLTQWVESHVGPDVEKAKAKAQELWQSVYDAAIGKGFTPEEAEEEANTVVANSPLAQTIAKLEQTKTDLDEAMANLYAAGNNATQEEIDRVADLMGQVRELQKELGLLTDDSVQYMQQSYELVKEGKGTEKNAGAALAYVDYVSEQDKANIAARRQAAEDLYTATAFAAQFNNDAELANQALQTYERTMAEIDADEAALEGKRQEMLNNIMGGEGAQHSENGTEDVEGYVEDIELLADAWNTLARVTGEDGGIDMDALANAFKLVDFSKLSEAFPDAAVFKKGFKTPESVLEAYASGSGSIIATDIEELMGLISQYVEEELEGKQPTIDAMEALYQTMLENGYMGELDPANFTGPLLTAHRAHLVAQAAGEDGILTPEEMGGLLKSEEWLKAGSNAAETVNETVSDVADTIIESAEEAVTRVKNAPAVKELAKLLYLGPNADQWEDKNALPFNGQDVQDFVDTLDLIDVLTKASEAWDENGFPIDFETGELLPELQKAADLLGLVIDRDNPEWGTDLRYAIETALSGAVTSVQEKGENLPKGLAEGIQNGQYAAEEAAENSGEAILKKYRETFKTHSPSLETMEMGLNLDRGLSAGIEAGLNDMTRVAERSGLAVGYAFADGIEKSIWRVQSAVDHVIAVTGRLPYYGGGGGNGGGGQGGEPGNSYSTSSAIYIDKYNQYSGADADALLGLMADMNATRKRGYGARG